MKKKKRSLRPLITVLGLVIVGLIIVRLQLNHHRHKAIVPVMGEGFGSVGEFKFTNQNGKPVSNVSLKGNVWVSNFIFTRCMGPCPILSTKMARLAQEYQKQDNLKFVSFSVDPDYDTPEILASYAQTYGAKEGMWHFLTGAREKIYTLIRTSFHLAVEENDHAAHDEMAILHSLHFVLVDKTGEIKGYYNSNDPEALGQLRADLNLLLKKA